MSIHQPASRQLAVDIGGRSFVLESDDRYLDSLKDGFEPDTVALFRTLATGADVVLDVGANIGCTTLLFSGLARRVLSFEPSPSTFGFLRANVERAGCANVSLFNAGLGDQAGQAPLTFSPTNRSGGFVSTGVTASADLRTESVAIHRLDDVVEAEQPGRIDVVKIDVEGFEGHVLRGAARTLDAHRPVVVLEVNHWCLNAFQRTSIPDFFDQMRATFPVLLALDGAGYLDLHEPGDNYTVMHQHITRRRFQNLLGAFDEARLAAFRADYTHGFPVRPA